MTNRANNPVLSALKIADPDKWRRTIRDALKAEGTVSLAAVALDVNRATLFRWLQEDPALRTGIELHDKPGRRPKKTP